jgi:DNA-binding GntR family transcriptional regulator
LNKLRSYEGIAVLYKNIAKKLRFRINSDEFAIGDVLPTERQLMEEYQASRVSIRKAIDELVAIDLIEKKQGSGTYIKQKEVVHLMDQLRSGLESSQEIGQTITSDVLEFAIVYPDDEIANRLKIKTTDRVYYIKRLRKVNDRPQIIEESYMPVSLFPELTIRTLERSKFEYIEKNLGLIIEGSYQEFSPVIPDKEEERLLNLQGREPVLQITSLSNFQDGTIFDYSIMKFKASEYLHAMYIRRETQGPILSQKQGLITERETIPHASTEETLKFYPVQ